MAKRSAGEFKRRPHDLYDTPLKAVLPLLPFLQPGTRFIEPCFGNGYLSEHLQAHDHVCVGAWDIEPRFELVKFGDAMTHIYDLKADACITNPPWSRPILHSIITNLSVQMRTWLLFDADWLFTKQAEPYWPMCRTVVAVGRVRWIEGSTMDGKDNAAWFEFDANHNIGPLFIGRRD